MDATPILQGVAGIISVMVLSAFGVPIGISMSVVALIGISIIASPTMALLTLKTLPYATASNFAFVIFPMFILMGLVMSEAGVMTDLYNSLNRWLARMKGSLLMVTTAASALFGAVSGSTIVNAAVFTRIAFPEMVRLGYKPGVGAAAIASAGTLASLIPPSLGFVFFAILTDESIGKLLMAGLLPGILTTIIYMIGISVCVHIFKDWAPPPGEGYTWREKFSSLKTIWPVVLLSVIILGGIYSGITPPSAAGGVGAIGAIVITTLQRRLKWHMLWSALKRTVEICAVLAIILIGGLLLSRFLTLSGAVHSLIALFEQIGMGKYQFMGMVVVLFLILGMFMETTAIMVITTPLFYPIVIALGIDIYWYAVIIVKLIEIAVVSPPVGINLFTVVAATDQKLSMTELYKGVIWFILFDLITIGLLFLFPVIATWLPHTMM